MNHLQYINSVYRHVTNNSSIRYLISGADLRVRQVFGKYITRKMAVISLILAALMFQIL